jgi:hypothetical protein
MGFKGTPLQTSGLITRVRQNILVGAAAGNYTLSGVAKDHDKLLQVLLVKLALTEGTPNTITWTVSNLTSEFTISAANTINNTGGTSGTGGFLVVLWYDMDYGITTKVF